MILVVALASPVTVITEHVERSVLGNVRIEPIANVKGLVV